MSIPKNIKIKNGKLPDSPGVYIMKDARGRIIYVGKASSLRSRVGSYFNRPADIKTAELVKQVSKIDYIRTKTVLEALILEAVKIKEYQPKYNIIQKDDRSFLYLAITREKYPKILLVRGHELKQPRINHREAGSRSRENQELRIKKIFGPFTSPNSLRAALNILRRIFPWSDCDPLKKKKYFRTCFDYHLKLCPGVCIGAITSRDYKRIIRGLILFFEGKRTAVIREMKNQMRLASREQRFEDASVWRNRLYALEHIQDVAVLTRDIKRDLDKGENLGANIFGRIEGYDISNISGTSAVGSMVVFSGGEPDKYQYRKFKIKTVKGANDVAMMGEVLTRRFSHNVSDWPLPDIILIDGGVPQVNVARRVLNHYHLGIPIVGIAKGIDRKKDELILSKDNPEMELVANQFKDILVRVRDEAHRFAISFYRRTHRRKLVGG